MVPALYLGDQGCAKWRIRVSLRERRLVVIECIHISSIPGTEAEGPGVSERLDLQQDHVPVIFGTQVKVLDPGSQFRSLFLNTVEPPHAAVVDNLVWLLRRVPEAKVAWREVGRINHRTDIIHVRRIDEIRAFLLRSPAVTAGSTSDLGCYVNFAPSAATARSPGSITIGILCQIDGIGYENFPHFRRKQRIWSLLLNKSHARLASLVGSSSVLTFGETGSTPQVTIGHPGDWFYPPIKK